MWKIHIRRGHGRFHHLAQDLQAALAVACVLLRDGIEVEYIEGPENLRIAVEAIRPLCEAGN